MGDIKYVSYAEWIALIAAIQKKGMNAREFEQIKHTYPLVSGEAYTPLIYNELGKLEQYLLNSSFAKFQKAIGRCLEEMDLEIAESAMRNLKKNLAECLFFDGIEQYPPSVRARMAQEIQRIVESFWQEYLKYIKRLEYADGGSFVQDLAYMCKKKITVC